MACSAAASFVSRDSHRNSHRESHSGRDHLGCRDRDLGVTSLDERPPRAPVIPAGPDAASPPSPRALPPSPRLLPLSPFWRRARAREAAGGDSSASSTSPRASPLSSLRFSELFSLSPFAKRPAGDPADSSKLSTSPPKQRLARGEPGAWQEELREERHARRADRGSAKAGTKAGTTAGTHKAGTHVAKAGTKAGTQGQEGSLALPRRRFSA